MYNRSFLLCVLVSLFVIALSACSTTAPPATPLATSTTGAVQPAPASQSADKGSVTGRIFQSTQQGSTIPLSSVTVYLGNIGKSSSGADMVVTLDRISAPKAVTNDQGNFTFTDIAPGRYGLMVDTPSGAALLNNPDNGGDLIVEVTAGKTLDLGDLKYPLVY